MTDRPPHRLELQSRVRFQSRAFQIRQSRAVLLHSAIRTSAMVVVVCVYLLSVVVDFASCSSVSVQPSDVAQASLGTFNFKELDEIVYDIEILKVPIPEPSRDLGVHSEGDRSLSNGDESISLDDETNKPDDINTNHSEVLCINRE